MKKLFLVLMLSLTLLNVTFSQSLFGLLLANSPTADSRPYKVYTAIVNQTGTNAPTIVVLENTLGVDLTPSYVANGTYRLTAPSSIFLTNKVALFAINGYEDLGNLGFRRSNDISLYLYSGLNGVLGDDIINKATIEIRVYN